MADRSLVVGSELGGFTCELNWVAILGEPASLLELFSGPCFVSVVARPHRPVTGVAAGASPSAVMVFGPYQLASAAASSSRAAMTLPYSRRAFVCSVRFTGLQAESECGREAPRLPLGGERGYPADEVARIEHLLADGGKLAHVRDVACSERVRVSASSLIILSRLR